MKEWLKETEEALFEAITASHDGAIPLQNLYMLAPIIYSERQKTKNELLINKMIEANDKQVTSEWALDEESKDQYKFHFVSSYLFCFVVAGKIDDFKYDKIMEYVNSQIELFTGNYGIE